MDFVNGVPVISGDSSSSMSPSKAGRKGGSGSGTTSAWLAETRTTPPPSQRSPIDYSFQEIKTMDELPSHEPNGGRKPPGLAARNTAADAASSSNAASSAASADPASPVKSTMPGLRLSYNELTSLKGFVEAIDAVMGPDARSQLTWLDLSHNKLSSLNESIFAAFPNITCLYLHANQIALLSEVRKLCTLRHLQKVTFHGNPIQESRLNHGLKNPRSAIIWSLRECPIKSLDFVTITDTDRRNALRWSETNKPKKKKKQTDEEGEQ